MQKSLEILKHIHELYNGDVTDEAMRMFAEKNQEKIKAWQEAFENYALEDVLQMVDCYWTQKNNRTAPRVAQLLAMLNADKDIHRIGSRVETSNISDDQHNWHTFWNLDPALAYYLRDCEAYPSDKVHGLVFYRKAISDILAKKVNTLPGSSKLSYGQKIALMRRNGWDNGLYELVDELASEALGRPKLDSFESFQPAGMTLASHWRA